jgi:serine/threonine protein kinase/Tfp pilus assembly protein PilF
MANPMVLLRCVGKAAANFFGGGVAGDLLFEVLPDVAGDAWKWWHKDRDAEGRRQDLAALAQASPAEVKKQVHEIVHEVAGDKPPEQQKALEIYLSLVPGQVRKSLRRPSDPVGVTVPFEMSPSKAEDLIALLPAKLPRFKPGDRPLPGVDWELDELLGVGGFGEVWKARNPLLSSVPAAALKFCLDSSAASFLRNEAAVLDRVMRQGRHPGIVTLQHTYLSSETPCLEYEFVSGGDLAGLIQDWHRGPNHSTPIEISRVLHQLATVVGFAHAQDPPIVHRDLKPANILVQAGQGGWPQLKVADFGIGGVATRQAITQQSRGTSRGLFLATALRGSCTPLYASPQQLRGEAPDPRDDVYALGVIWYQMLTGDLTAGRPGGTRWHKRLVDLGLDAQVVDLLGQCFEDDLQDRVATAGLLAQYLGELLPSRKSDPAIDLQSAAHKKAAQLGNLIRELSAAAPAVNQPTPRPPAPPRPVDVQTQAVSRRIQAKEEAERRKREEHLRQLRELNEAVAANPDDAEARARRGEVQRQLGDQASAIADCTEAIRLNHGLARAYATRGSAYRFKGQLDLAIADCTEAIRLDPANVLAYFNRGEAHRLRRELEKALLDFTRAIELDPSYSWAFGSRGAAKQQKGDLAGALADLDMTLELDPDYAWAYVVRAETHRLRGEHDRAIADCNDAIRLQPDTFMAYATRGAAFRQKGDFATAMADLQQALRLKPDYQWARDQLELARRRHK